jgi:hypothetical protein
MIRGSGGPTADQVPIMASAGEYMMRAASVAKNRPALDAANYHGAQLTTVGKGGGVASVVLEVNSGGARMDALIVEVFRKAVQIKGGDVQVAFGRKS